MRHILRDDPCRRFVFGVTIEDAETRLWLASRAGVFVSDPFDYVEVRIYHSYIFFLLNSF